jgi:hypothetical protein
MLSTKAPTQYGTKSISASWLIIDSEAQNLARLITRANQMLFKHGVRYDPIARMYNVRKWFWQKGEWHVDVEIVYRKNGVQYAVNLTNVTDGRCFGEVSVRVAEAFFNGLISGIQHETLGI